MKTTITGLRNTETAATIVLDTSATKSEMFKAAQEAGFTGGKTSFNNLVNGKTESVKGWVFETIIVKRIASPVAPVRGDKNFDAVAALKGIGCDVIKQAKTETYGTIKCGKFRIQANPLRNGLFSVMVFPYKGTTSEELAKFFTNATVKSQYLKLGKLSAVEICEIAESHQ